MSKPAQATPDPMDAPPTDHGSDRYDYVEVEEPFGDLDPEGEWFTTLLGAPCPDCTANLFFTYIGPLGERPASTERGDWSVLIAHDDTCPMIGGHLR